jgi:hypothetical protein
VLRRALLTQPTAAETAIVAEDDDLLRDEAQAQHGQHGDDDDDETLDHGDKKKPTWEDIISDKLGFKEEIAKVIEEDLHTIPPGLSREERIEEQRLIAESSHSKRRNLNAKKGCWEHFQNTEFMKHRRAKRDRKIDLTDRSIFRKFSGIWYKNCPKESM